MIDAGGKLAGTLSNNGRVIVRGVFGGAQSGTGDLVVEPPGRLKEPVSDKDGILLFDWSADS